MLQAVTKKKLEKNYIFICWSDISPKELGACQAIAYMVV